MKEIKNYVRGNNKYTFVCETWETSRAWGHSVTMFKNDIQVSENRVTYYNRTWEMWTYQSAISGAIYNLIDTLSAKAIDEYKRNNNIKRLKTEVKENIINSNDELKELIELKSSIGNGNRGGNF